MVGMLLDAISKGLSSPLSIGKAIKETWGREQSAQAVSRTLSYAYQHGYLKRYGASGAHHYQLSPAGEQRLAQLNFRLIKFDPQNWDGRWRILIFDIPESRRPQRDMVRHLIRQLGMQPLQKSVWLTPADCREQFEQLRLAYGIGGKDLLLLEVRTSPVLENYKSHWW